MRDKRIVIVLVLGIILFIIFMTSLFHKSTEKEENNSVQKENFSSVVQDEETGEYVVFDEETGEEIIRSLELEKIYDYARNPNYNPKIPMEEGELVEEEN